MFTQSLVCPRVPDPDTELASTKRRGQGPVKCTWPKIPSTHGKSPHSVNSIFLVLFSPLAAKLHCFRCVQFSQARSYFAATGYSFLKWIDFGGQRNNALAASPPLARFQSRLVHGHQSAAKLTFCMIGQVGCQLFLQLFSDRLAPAPSMSIPDARNLSREYSHEIASVFDAEMLVLTGQNGARAPSTCVYEISTFKNLLCYGLVPPIPHSVNRFLQI
ncbi:hypothetical protein BKA62DRAFT_151982 [Auriculariales sp. MPI-PUGE-AT-0066]|nr:hypothetical protein BKA62DRAFT_151982 [Auriculariales sp. MPI-PUGE-AT-0066]